MGDELLPRRGGREREVEGLEQEEAEADGVAERHERLGVELGVDAAAGLGRLDDGRRAGRGARPCARGAARRRAGSRRAATKASSRSGSPVGRGAVDEVATDDGEDVLGAALEAVVGEQRVELVGGARRRARRPAGRPCR